MEFESRVYNSCMKMVRSGTVYSKAIIRLHYSGLGQFYSIYANV